MASSPFGRGARGSLPDSDEGGADTLRFVMTLPTLLQIVAALFPVSEIALGIFKRARCSTAAAHDRGFFEGNFA